MNSINLSRFHKFSGSNFKKRITEKKWNSSRFYTVRRFKSIKEKKIKKKKKKKRKFYSKLYTEFLFVPLFWVGKTEATLLF